MNKYMLLHVGFEPPTPEIMAKWNAWFESVATQAVEHGGFMGGTEISHDGSEPLTMDGDALTGFSIIEAESLEQAEELAKSNPFIKSIRVYEVRSHG
ncbi:MAG: YciI family protein [Pseudomonadota bacterium]